MKWVVRIDAHMEGAKITIQIKGPGDGSSDCR